MRQHLGDIEANPARADDRYPPADPLGVEDRRWVADYPGMIATRQVELTRPHIAGEDHRVEIAQQLHIRLSVQAHLDAVLLKHGPIVAQRLGELFLAEDPASGIELAAGIAVPLEQHHERARHKRPPGG